MTARAWFGPAIGFTVAVLVTAFVFWMGYRAAELDRLANFNDRALLDPSQVIIRLVAG